MNRRPGRAIAAEARAIERFKSLVDKNGPIPIFAPELGPCHIWKGGVHKRSGYGVFCVKSERIPAHRFAWIAIARKRIPKDKPYLDHLCRVRHCVNDGHLEPVTNQENTKRGVAGQWRAEQQRNATHCENGHEYTPENVRPHTNPNGSIVRKCRACHRDAQKRYVERKATR